MIAAGASIGSLQVGLPLDPLENRILLCHALGITRVGLITQSERRLTEEEAVKVLRRGVRLDEKTPGSGLGLDIVKELVDVYGGSLQLKRSVLGGLLAELRLPAAKVAGFRTFASIRKE